MNVGEVINIAVIGQSIKAGVVYEKKQYQLFLNSIRHLPREEQEKQIKLWREMREKIREEMKEERRHQELCSAIRYSRPRGFGIFW